MVAFKEKDDVDELRARALQWLAQREHSRQELRDKATEKGGDELQQPAVREELKRHARRLARLSRIKQIASNSLRLLIASATGAATSTPAGHPGPTDRPSSRPPSDPRDAPTEGDDAAGLARTVERLLDALEQAGHLSQQRFVESRIRLRAQRHGNRRIEHELRYHGLESTPEARQALAADEYDRARQVWTRKFGTLPGTPAERARQLRFMAGRGFTAETVHRVLKEAAHPQAPD